MTCKELRKKAQLFPREMHLFKHGKMDLVEHLSDALCKNFQDDPLNTLPSEMPKFENYLNGEERNNMLFVPSSFEIMEHHMDTKKEAPSPKFEHYEDFGDPMEVDG